MAESNEGIACEVIAEAAEEKAENAKAHTAGSEPDRGQKSAPAKKAKESAAPKEEKAEEAAAPKEEKVKKSASKKGAAKAASAPKQEPLAQEAPKVKSTVLAGANPNIEFYQISDDLPVHLL